LSAAADMSVTASAVSKAVPKKPASARLVPQSKAGSSGVSSAKAPAKAGSSKAPAPGASNAAPNYAKAAASTSIATAAPSLPKASSNALALSLDGILGRMPQPGPKARDVDVQASSSFHRTSSNGSASGGPTAGSTIDPADGSPPRGSGGDGQGRSFEAPTPARKAKSAPKKKKKAGGKPAATQPQPFSFSTDTRKRRDSTRGEEEKGRNVTSIGRRLASSASTSSVTLTSVNGYTDSSATLSPRHTDSSATLSPSDPATPTIPQRSRSDLGDSASSGVWVRQTSDPAAILARLESQESRGRQENIGSQRQGSNASATGSCASMIQRHPGASSSATTSLGNMSARSRPSSHHLHGQNSTPEANPFPTAATASSSALNSAMRRNRRTNNEDDTTPPDSAASTSILRRGSGGSKGNNRWSFAKDKDKERDEAHDDRHVKFSNMSDVEVLQFNVDDGRIRSPITPTTRGPRRIFGGELQASMSATNGTNGTPSGMSLGASIAQMKGSGRERLPNVHQLTGPPTLVVREPSDPRPAAVHLRPGVRDLVAVAAES